MSWKKFADCSRGRKQKEALANAVDAYASASAQEEGVPPEAYRDWGKLALKLDKPETAKVALNKYLQLAPDAWDVRFVRRELEKI